MRRALLVTGGRREKEFCLRYQKEHPFDYTIAVDSGMQFFYETGQKPDFILGDFDSVAFETLHFFERKEGIEWIRLDSHKDDTDTEAALRWAIEKGYEEIHILGGTGSRLDHTLSNIGLLGIGLKAGVTVLLVDSQNRIRMIRDTFCLSKKEQFGTYLSLIPVTPVVTGITLVGMKYPLTDATMSDYRSLGVSNEILEQEAKIYLKEGILLVLETKDEKGEIAT